MPPRINGDADQMYWVLSRSDTFTVKSAYMFVAPSVPSENTHIWNIIWRWKSTQRVCTFMWLIVHNRLKTHWELYRRHIVDVRNELLEMWTRCGGCFACSTWFIICKKRMGGFGSIKLSTCFFLHACMRLACVQNAWHIDHHLDWSYIFEWRLRNYGIGGINSFVILSLVARPIWCKIFSTIVNKFKR